MPFQRNELPLGVISFSTGRLTSYSQIPTGTPHLKPLFRTSEEPPNGPFSKVHSDNLQALHEEFPSH